MAVCAPVWCVFFLLFSSSISSIRKKMVDETVCLFDCALAKQTRLSSNLGIVLPFLDLK